MEINGIAHVVLTAGDFARSRAFYGELLPFLGLAPVIDAPEFFYCVGGRTAFGIRPADRAHAGESFSQGRPGLHHVCFRLRSREEIDRTFSLDEQLLHVDTLFTRVFGTAELPAS